MTWCNKRLLIFIHKNLFLSYTIVYWKVYIMTSYMLSMLFLANCKNDENCGPKGRLLKDKLNLVTFHESILINLWNIQLILVFHMFKNISRVKQRCFLGEKVFITRVYIYIYVHYTSLYIYIYIYTLVEVRFQHSGVAGSISSGGDNGMHCWWDPIWSKQLFRVPYVACGCLPDFLVMVI